MEVVICSNCKSIYFENVNTCVECFKTDFTVTDSMYRKYIRWVQTDPDRFQFGRQLDEGVFEFKEYDWLSRFNDNPDEHITLDEALTDEENWIEGRINIDKIPENELQSAWEAYYSSLEEIKELYGDEWKFIVAECYFEQEISGKY